MGCDIHMKIERRIDGQWVNVPFMDSWSMKYAKRFWQHGEVLMPDLFNDRNYDLFGVLANVRNGTWGDELSPIADPRGWPGDSPTDPNTEDYELGDHSFSFVTLAELLAYPWDNTTRKRGWVSHEQAEKFRADGIRPSSYSAGGNRGEYIEWTQDIRSDVSNWPTVILPILEMLGEPHDVRLVFGFDN